MVSLSIAHTYIQIRSYIHPHTMLLALGKTIKENLKIDDVKIKK